MLKSGKSTIPAARSIEVAKLRIQGSYFLVQSVTQYKISVSDHENNLKCGPKVPGVGLVPDAQTQ